MAAPGSAADPKSGLKTGRKPIYPGLRWSFFPLAPRHKRLPSGHRAVAEARRLRLHPRLEKSGRCPRSRKDLRANCRQLRVVPTNKQWQAKATTAREKADVQPRSD